MTDACSSCRFWDRYGTDYDANAQRKGDCRRRPPAISNAMLATRLAKGDVDDIDDRFVSDLYLSSAYPITHEVGWCGEFETARSVDPLC